MSTPSRPPVSPWIPPRSNVQPATPAVRRRTAKPKWKGAWIAGLVCALLPLFAVGLIAGCLWWVNKNPDVQSTAANQIIGGIFAAGSILLLCSLLFAFVGLICAVCVMIMGAPMRGLLLLFLTLPVFGIYFLSGLLNAVQTHTETVQIRGTIYLQ